MSHTATEWYRQSPRMIRTYVQGGCYPEDGPSPTSAVTLAVSPNASRASVEAMVQLLADVGWPQEKVRRVVWGNAPKLPR